MHTMYHRLVLLTLLAFAVSVVVLAASNAGSEQAGQKQEQKPKPSSKDSGASLTGCIDEQNGHYVMVNDRTLDPIADLVADGFDREDFAKHLGHKVIVRGTSSPGENRPLFKVRSIEAVSDTCAPQAPK